MEPDYAIIYLPIDTRLAYQCAPPVEPKHRPDLKITPKFIPDGWRVLRPMEGVQAGDYRWKKVARVANGGYYVPATKIGDLVGYPITYVRRM